MRILVISDVHWLGTRPSFAYLGADGVRLLCVHAVPSDPLYRYLGPDPHAWEREAAGVEADVVLVGHTHIQFELRAGNTRVVNPGSVGQPRDGDPRAAYAVIEDGAVALRRVAYDVERTVTRYGETGGAGGPAGAGGGSVVRDEAGRGKGPPRT